MESTIINYYAKRKLILLTTGIEILEILIDSNDLVSNIISAAIKEKIPVFFSKEGQCYTISEIINKAKEILFYNIRCLIYEKDESIKNEFILLAKKNDMNVVQICKEIAIKSYKNNSIDENDFAIAIIQELNLSKLVIDAVMCIENS